MCHIRFRLELRTRTYWGSLQCSRRSLAGFKGPISKVEGAGHAKGNRRGGEGNVMGGKNYCMQYVQHGPRR